MHTCLMYEALATGYLRGVTLRIENKSNVEGSATNIDCGIERRPGALLTTESTAVR